MEDNKHDNNNDHKKSDSAYLSKRGQYKPELKQTQQHQQSFTHSAQATNIGQTIPSDGQYSSQSYTTNQYSPQQTTATLKHSGLGIASFVISIVAIIITILSIILIVVGAVSIGNEDPSSIIALQDPNSINNMLNSGELPDGFVIIIIGSLLFLFTIGISIVGGILGLIAVFQKNRKKVFSILGLIFNGCILLGYFLLLIIGVVANL